MNMLEFDKVTLPFQEDMLEQVVNRYGFGVYCLDAPMGSGKTTWISAMVQFLGATDAASSPTFSLMNVYNTQSGLAIAHLDLYRLNSVDEMIEAGLLEVCYEYDYVFIEWPEKIYNFLPDAFVRVNITLQGDAARKFTFTRILNDK
jgi:tRNA threonylcarbamoyladenosine biosynthesis protein TsaE